MQELEAKWQRPLQVTICDYCDWSYLLAPGAELPICPHCYRMELTPLTDDDLDQLSAPELILPFAAPAEQVQQQINSFANSFRFTPQDLQAKKLHGRLRRVFIPRWLVDSDVTAAWQVEAGFNYQVVSHQESFKQGDWQSREVQETRIRWEVRAGQLQRRYDNVPAPALEEIGDVQAKLGAFDREGTTVYAQELLDGAMVRLPNRDQQDAWPDTHPKFKDLAADECRQASGADHIRQYKWDASYASQQWSLLLLPVYSTYYFDDDQQPVPILLHGRTGQISGIKRASMKRAKRMTTLLALLAALFFILTLALFLLKSPLFLLTFMLIFFLGVGAIVPLAYVSRFNRNQKADIPISRS